MSFVYRNGITFDSIADFLEDATNGLYKTLEDAGWTSHYVVQATSGATDKVYKSTGEAGDEVIYVRIIQTSTTSMHLRIGTWYPTAGLTYNVNAPDSNEVGGTASWTVQYGAVAAQIGWIVADKDFCAFCLKQDGYYSNYGFGTINRLGPTQWSARTTLNGAQNVLGSGSGNTVLTVNSFDVAKLTAGQKVFVVNDGPTNKGTLVRCTVVSVDGATQITVLSDDATQTNFDTGALVGYDPMPTCIIGEGQVYGAGNRGNPTKGSFFLYSPATTRMVGSAQETPVHGSGARNLGWCGIMLNSSGQSKFTYEVEGPDARGVFTASPWVLDGHVNSSYSWQSAQYQARGFVERICCLTYGTVVSPEDTYRDGAVTWLIVRDEVGNQYLTASGGKLIGLRTVA